MVVQDDGDMVERWCVELCAGLRPKLNDRKYGDDMETAMEVMEH